MGDEVKLYGTWFSPFVKSVEMVLKLKGVEYEYIEEDLKSKSSILLKINPIYKKVPVLIHNGNPIVESLIIIEYIDEAFSGPSIFPKDPHERSKARFWMKFINEKEDPQLMIIGTKNAWPRKCREGLNKSFPLRACRALTVGTRHLGSCSIAAVIMVFHLFIWAVFSLAKACWKKGDEGKKAVEEAIEVLKVLENEINGKKFFGGDNIGVVDISANFIAHGFPIIQEFTGNKMMTEDKFPNLCKWAYECSSNPIVKEYLPSKDRLLTAPRNEFGSLY